MGFLGLGRVATSRAAEVLAPSSRARLASPWSPGLSTSIMAADWLGLADIPASREKAMKVPAVVAARNIICTGISQAVIKAYRKDAEIQTPVWAYRTDSDIPPAIRLMWTVDDLFFSGFSLWEVARSAAGQIGDAVRIPPERWEWDADYRILIDQDPVQAKEVILFIGWDEGLLLTGSKTITDAIDLADTVSQRVRVPQPHTLLKATTPEIDPDDAEKRELIDGYVAARRTRDGAVSYVPYGIDVDRGGEAPISLYENGRNASVLDFARLTGVPASMLDASQVAASLTYETKAGQRSILNDRLRQRASVIDARLSMDDVTPRGTRISLDLSHLQVDETGTAAPTED